MSKAVRYAAIAPIPAVPSVTMLTYRVPERLDGELTAGVRVLVPLGRRRVTGIVTALETQAPEGIECRDIGDVLDREPVVSAELLDLARWMSDYYLAALPDVLSLAIGRGLTTASKRIVELKDASLARRPSERSLVEALSEAGGRLDTVRLRKRLGGRSLDSALAQLVASGAVAVEERLDRPVVRELNETIVEVTALADDDAHAALFARAPKRREIYDFLREQPGRRAASSVLAQLFGRPTAQVAALEEAGLVARKQREVYREASIDAEGGEPLALSTAQCSAVDAITGALDAFAPFLLHGVTSSGKTEVYLRAIQHVLAAGGSALVLVPEISLTHQVVARLVGRFGPTVAVLHSELSRGERWDQWRRILRREARIAVGARSAVLAPLADLRLIIVDEEHDAAYKQAEGVRYHGRDVAIMRARRVGCPVVLGSATPSIESWRHATAGRYRLLELPERVTASPLPSIEVVDLRGRDIVATGGLSDHLARLVRRNFDERGQTLLFLNRRGYASNVQCWECGAIIQCDHCSVGMTLHQGDRRLRCHHCDAVRAVPARCPDCNADALTAQGLGTQRLETSLRALVPAARIERLDRDTAARKGAARAVLEQWRAGRIDVLIGTQMITKGHDAPGVTLVGVVQADLSLGVPDFRAAERTFQILSQVAGRAGRGERRGRVVFQTYQPDHSAIAAAVRHDYTRFAEHELAEREELGYPPHARMALLRFEGAATAAVQAIAGDAARALERLAARTGDLTLRGPAPSPIERVKSRYRYQIQLRSRSGQLVRHAAAAARALVAERARRADVRVIADVDPVDML